MLDRAKLQKVAKLLEFEKDFKSNPAVKTLKELERVDFAIDETNKRVDEVQTGCEQIASAINTLDQTKADKEDVAQQIETIARIPGRPGNQGPKGDKGDRGEKGEKGDTTIVDRVIERTEVIKEIPIVTENIVEKITEDIAGETIVDRINQNTKQIKKDRIEGLDDIERIAKANASNYKAYTGVTETRVKELIASNDTTHDTLQGVTDRGATTTNEITLPSIKAKTSAGIALKADNGDTAVLIGAGGGKNATFYDGVKLDAQTASRVALFDANKNLVSSTLTSADLEAIPTTYAKLDGTNHPFTYVKTPNIRPNADSTTAVQITKADGTTSVLNVDTTNSRVGIGTTAPGATLDLAGTTGIVNTATGSSGSSSGVGIVNYQSWDGAYNASGDRLGFFGVGGYTPSDTRRMTGAIIGYAESTWTSGNFPTYLAFETSATNARTEKMRITGSGNVGIGTTAPNALLEVYKLTGISNLRIDNGNTGNGYNGSQFQVFASGSQAAANAKHFAMGNANALSAGGEDRFAIQARNDDGTFKADLMSIMQNTGNVGIGTSTPSALLDVGGAFTTPPTSVSSMTPSAYITGNSNTINGVVMGNASTGTTADYRFIIRDSLDSYVGVVYGGSGRTSTAAFGLAANTWGGIFTNGAAANARHLLFGTVQEKDLIFGTKNLERMRILSDGKVGIGTTAPQFKLNVIDDQFNQFGITGTSSARAGAFKIANDNSIVTRFGVMGSAFAITNLRNNFFIDLNNASQDFAIGYSNFTELFRFTGGGKLGIGTATPADSLHISSNKGTNYLRVNDIRSTTGDSAGIMFGTGVDALYGKSLIVHQETGTDPLNGRGDLIFCVDSNNDAAGVALTDEKMRITSAGNVGIGTTAPSAKLHSLATTEQLRLGYDASNYLSATVASNNAVTLANAVAADININCGTDKTVVLTETVWVDIDSPILIRTTGVGIPTLATFNGNLTMPQWAVNDFNQCESQEFIHEWKEGSACYWHLHLNTNGLDATDRYVKFELEYAYSVAGVWTFPAVVTTDDILIPANTADKTQIIMSLGNFTPTNAKIGDHCVARLKRVAAAGTAPTNNPWIPMLQMHVQKDTIGSRQMTAK
jgi:hypothetical protein